MFRYSCDGCCYNKKWRTRGYVITTNFEKCKSVAQSEYRAPRYNTANLRATFLHHIYNSPKTTILLFPCSNPKLLSSDPRPEHLPILVLTAYSSPARKITHWSSKQLTAQELISRYRTTYRWQRFRRGLVHFKESVWVFWMIGYCVCQCAGRASVPVNSVDLKAVTWLGYLRWGGR